MKNLMGAALIVASTAAHAQWGGFLDPNIMREAGAAAASGNLRLNNLEIDNNRGGPTGIGGSHTPTAAEIAAEIRAQERQERMRIEAAARSKREQAARAHIERMYASEFGR